MKFILHFFSFLLLCISGVSGQTKEPIDKIEHEMKSCLDMKENQTTAGMCDCTYKALEKWDSKLNATYKALLVKLDANSKSKLTEAQRQWIKFRDKEIELIDATVGRAEGTLSRVVRANSVLEITKERAIDLEALSAMVEGL